MERTTEHEAIQKCIKIFIYEQFPISRSLELSVTDNLFSAGVVDSLGILDLVTFLENEFQVVVTDDELTPENFETIEGMGRFLEQKKSEG